MDTMNYWIERTNSELRETLRHVDILMINDSEPASFPANHNLLRAAKHIFRIVRLLDGNAGRRIRRFIHEHHGHIRRASQPA